MTSQKNSYQYTLQIIADILSFENSIDVLREKMISNSIDWEQFVFIASDYLVLTTCYCRLKQKNLLNHLPEELELYLEEITTINRNRNTTLIHEIKNIATIFNENSINYVFLKGSAYLVKNYYDDLGERMLGDIDILVDETQIEASYQLLLEQDYTGTTQGISAKYFDHKHLPRLQSNINLAAVEIHKKVLLKPYNGVLNVDDILREKECVQQINVASDKHLLFHSILNFQANDSGYTFNRISLKSIYDLLIIQKHFVVDADTAYKPAYFENYFSIAKIFFDDFIAFKTKKLVNTIFLVKLKHPNLRKFIDMVVRKIEFLKTIFTSRIWFFMNNKSYRKDLIGYYSKVLGFTKLKNS